MAAADLPFWKPPPPERKDLRQFGLLFAVLTAASAAYLAWTRGPGAATEAAVVCALLILVSMAAPRLLTPAWWPWMVLVRVLGYVNSHLLLGIVFYLMFTPIGLVMRLCGRDPLERDFARARRTTAEGGSFWQRRELSQLASDHFRHQF